MEKCSSTKCSSALLEQVDEQGCVTLITRTASVGNNSHGTKAGSAVKVPDQHLMLFRNSTKSRQRVELIIHGSPRSLLRFWTQQNENWEPPLVDYLRPAE